MSEQHAINATHYGNAPLPGFLADQAYISPNGREFALPVTAARRFLQLCRDAHIEVDGFETWLPTTPSPTDLLHGCEGDADACERALGDFTVQYGESVVFNIWCKPVEK